MLIKKLEQSKRSLIKPPVSQKIKTGLVVLKPGQEIGKHKTNQKEEIIIILKGSALVSIENEKKIVQSNYLTYIPEGKLHNIKNTSNEILKYIYLVGLL